MPRISNIELLDSSEQATLSIRTRTAVQNLPRLIGESYGKLGAHLQDLNECPADVPFVAYYNMDMEDLDVEIGFPVARALPGKDDIQPGSIPAGKNIFCMYRGSYQGLAAAYDDLGKWLAENRCEPRGTMYEHYYNGPEFPESELLTKIVMPIKG